MKNGIFTSCSAGNNGPYRSKVSNSFPGAMTVAANTIDRVFVTKVVLRNGQQFLGNSLNSFNLDNTTYPLVYSGNAGHVTFGIDFIIARLCIPGTLSTNITKGGIILCNRAVDGEVVLLRGAAGLIAPSYDDIAQAESLRYKFLGSLAVCRACCGVLRFIMEGNSNDE